MRHPHSRPIGVLASLIALPTVALAADPWVAPSSYYDGATGTGTTLKAQLYDAMRTGHVQRSYGDFRYSSRYHDADPNNPSNILLVYNRQSVSANWDSGATWNREHVWPQSRQPGSASNSTKGNLGDPHALRPCNSSLNGSRGNKPYGYDETTGSYGSQGSYYFPGDTDKGDIARCLMYSDTRWGPEKGLALVDSVPSGNQMGDLSSLVAWHYLDPPDEFERRRNHVIYGAEGNLYPTNNRNAYIDHPEFVWSVYMDQNNDTSLAVSTPDTSGFSWLPVSLDPVFVGATPAAQPVTVTKDGVDGTYYEIALTGDAASPDEGRYNAFPMTLAGTDSATVAVSIDPAATAAAGPKSGEVIIDNLDVTTGAGPGHAAQDADDVIAVSLDVLDHAEGSFAPAANDDTLAHDFGTVAAGSTATFSFPVYNLEQTPAFTGSLWITPGTAAGDAAAFDLDLVGELVLAGSSTMVTVTLDTATPGSYAATLQVLANDDPALAGAAAGDPLTLTLAATVGTACPADLNGDGSLNLDDLDLFIDAFLSSDLLADLNNDGSLNLDDVDAFIGSFLSGCP